MSQWNACHYIDAVQAVRYRREIVREIVIKYAAQLGGMAALHGRAPKAPNFVL